jgi:putative inorganic carbon (hco3(-)) transporter
MSVSTSGAVTLGRRPGRGFGAGIGAGPGRLRRVPSAVWLAALGVCAAGAVAGAILKVGALPALVLLAGAPVALVLLAKPDLAVVLTTFLLYINFPAVLTKQHNVPGPIAGAFVLMLASPIAYAVIAGRERFRSDPALVLMVALVGCQLLSTFGAVDVGLALDRVQQLATEGVLLYWLIINTVRSLATLRKIIWATLVAASLLSVLSLYQDLTGSYQQEFGGLAYRNYQEDTDTSETDAVVRRQKWDRAQGPVDEPNRFAQILIVLLPLAGYLYRNPRSRVLRNWAVALGGLTLVGVGLTLSRGALVTLGVMSFVMLGFKWLKPWHLLAALLGAAVVLPAVSPFFVARLASIVDARHVVAGAADAQEADGAIRGRTTEMLAALNVFRDHPVVGVGPAQFPPFYFVRYSKDAEIKFRDLDVPRRAHNLYLEMAAECGALGLATFLAVVAVLLNGLWQARRTWLGRDRDAADLVTAFCLSLSAYLCTAMFLHLSYQRYYWFLLALASAALHVLHRTGAAPADRQGLQAARSMSAVVGGGRWHRSR